MSKARFDKEITGAVFDRMSAAEKAAFVRDFERGTKARDTRPMTARERAQLSRQFRKRPGRPRVGQGSSRVQISMERGLLSRVDAQAKARNVTRSQFIADALRRTLGPTA